MKPFHFEYGLRTKDKERSVRKCKRRPTLFILFHKILYNTFIMNISNQHLNNQYLYDKLSLEDTRKLYEMKENEELLKNYNFPKQPSTDGFYHIYVTDCTKKSGRKAIKSKTLEGLQEKVLLHEKGASGTARKRFKDVFQIVLSNKLLYIKSSEKLISAKNTVRRTNSDYNRYFSGTAFEKKFIDEITKKDIENICLMNLKRYEMRKKAFASLRGILKSVFDYAFSEYLINDNIYNRIIFKKFNDMLIRDVPTSERVHSNDEVTAIMNELHRKQKARPKYSSVWALEMQILMGLRRGEIPPLTWDDVSDTQICICKEQLTSGNDFIVVGHTKNYKDRYFPITTDLHDFLVRLKVRNEKYYPNSNHLFPADNKNGIITNRAVYLVYQGICQKLNIPIKDGIIRGPHSFRRNAITDVVNATNGNIIMASSLFGNTPDVATQNYYTGANLEEAKNILNERKLM